MSLQKKMSFSLIISILGVLVVTIVITHITLNSIHQANLKFIFKNSDLKTIWYGLFMNSTKADCTTPHNLFQNKSPGETTSFLSQEFIPDENITCTQTTFVQCEEPKRFKPITNKTFNVALLRRPYWMDAAEFFNFSNCVYSGCNFQDDHIDESTHMVVIQLQHMRDNFTVLRRWPHQLYVATSWEPPSHLRAQFVEDRNSFWNSQFNLTATYRTDSDLFIPYGMLQFKPVPLNKRPDYYSIAQKKSKWVAWFVSSCRSPSKREIYVQQMQKIIPVDIYGRCGAPCQDPKPMCYTSNLLQYRYYLSFENNFCKDYVTEKLFKLFWGGMHVVPVVRGGFDYDTQLPDLTYINAGSFPNATELALFLQKLGQDTSTYAKYLERIDMYRILDGSWPTSIGCKVCKYLHTRKLQSQIDDLKKWISDDVCHAPKDIDQ
ncbi:alpha-(1,3)-fucosyltransferase C-like [Biomphalaria glabrata]|uniref:Fucosyltransferase n=1 Tax=Biomphalaria glabrata TaxID=6526 RepID=A0A9W2YRR5_BIOGL|nr:alpha-(1,3)-fucosyltransferase C-like [Biomphalaria glabrata]